MMGVYNYLMKKKKSMMEIFKNPHYRGKHIVLIAGRVFTAKTGDGVAEILRRLEKTHPKETPEVAYLPKARSMILWV
jgi:hypothetical protein